MAIRDLSGRYRSDHGVAHLPASETPSADGLEKSVHGYFGYRLAAARDLRFLQSQGRISLAIGLAFLAICLSLRALVLSTGPGAPQSVVAEGLVITGRPVHSRRW